MNLLAIDTTTEPGSCALWIAGRCVERACPAGMTSSETLLPTIRDLLADEGLGLAELDGIAFGAGPGAFTGLRVACGVTQGLAYPLGLPVLPVSSLAALAWQAGERAGDHILALLDARMGEVYYASYRRLADSVEALAAPAVAAPDAIPLPTDGGWRIAGNALDVHPRLRERLAELPVTVLPATVPQASAVAALGAAMLRAGLGQPASEAWPLYVRDKVALTTAERLAAGGKA